MNGGNLNTSVTIDEDGTYYQGFKKINIWFYTNFSELNLLDGDIKLFTGGE